MPFDYYTRLSGSDQAIYRKSDRIARIELPDARALGPAVDAVQDALAADDRGAVERAAGRLALELMAQLEVAPVTLRVLAVRPSDSSGELHGLYFAEEGEQAVVQVWMRTAARRQVVAPRTFLRTLLHELCHHLDYTLFGLDDSFHTEGFFQRESSLTRELLAVSGRDARKRSVRTEPQAKKRTPRRRARRPDDPQLELFPSS